MTPTDKPPPIDPDVIPQVLRERAQWVCWRFEDDGDGKPQKVPYDVKVGARASTKDPSAWVGFEEAMSEFVNGGYSGIGYVFTAEDPFTGIDLDDCINEHEEMVPSAKAIVAELNSYTEISPSGRGVKIFVVGKKPPGAQCKSSEILGFKATEVYETGRYFTVTGRHYPGTPLSVESRQPELDALCSRLWPPKRPHPRTAVPVSGGFVGDDAALIDVACRMTNGEKFKRLWAGDISGHRDDHSRADMALCSKLAFLTGNDAVRMDRLFRQSGLFREKWDQRRGDRTYGEITIENAISGCTQVYTPRAKRTSAAKTGVAQSAPLDQPKAEPPADHEHSAERGRALDVGSPMPPVAQTSAGAGDGNFALTDLGNAERLVAKFGDRVRYCHQNGKWYIWDGGRWRVDRSGDIDYMAAESARAIRDEATRTAEPERQKSLLKWAHSSESRQRLEAAVAVARSNPAVAVTLHDFDADPWKLNVLNGTIDLRSGTLLPARREDLLTQQAPVMFDPEATCPQFDRFLNQITAGDTLLGEFVLRLLGHCLTGDVSEQYLPIFNGPGGNGKSVLVDTVRGVMGDYAGIAAPSLLLDSTFQDHPTEIAELKGKRLVIASENERCQSLKLQLVKRLTGDATLKGRFMRQDFFEFLRTCKTVLVTNNLPVVHEKSEAVARRLLVVPFGVTIPEGDRDRRLMIKLKEEWPGILRRLVQGCLSWQRNGLDIPAIVRGASAAYLGAESNLEMFYATCCVQEREASVPAKELWDAYDSWTQQFGLPRESQKVFWEFFTRCGHISKTHRAGGRVGKHRFGLRLRGLPGQGT